jgi:uncharacterized protein YqgC (DUF456 family)
MRAPGGAMLIVPLVAFTVLAALGTFGWYGVFANHTARHAPFMMRPLAWLAILLAGYLAGMWAGRRIGVNRPRHIASR